eukprot:scaffold1347_cov350-Pavlova_lutheri.AAC.41
MVDNNGISICMDSIWIKKSIDDQTFVAAAPMTRSVPTDTLDEYVILWKAPTCTNIFSMALKMSNGRSVRNQHPLFVPHPLDPFNGWFNPNRQKHLTPPRPHFVIKLILTLKDEPPSKRLLDLHVNFTSVKLRN